MACESRPFRDWLEEAQRLSETPALGRRISGEGGVKTENSDFSRLRKIEEEIARRKTEIIEVLEMLAKAEKWKPNGREQEWKDAAKNLKPVRVSLGQRMQGFTDYAKEHSLDFERLSQEAADAMRAEIRTSLQRLDDTGKLIVLAEKFQDVPDIAAIFDTPIPIDFSDAGPRRPARKAIGA